MSGAENGVAPQGGSSRFHDAAPAEDCTPELTSSSSGADWETASEDHEEQEKAAAPEGSSRQATDFFSIPGQNFCVLTLWLPSVPKSQSRYSVA